MVRAHFELTGSEKRVYEAHACWFRDLESEMESSKIHLSVASSPIPNITPKPQMVIIFF